MEFETKALHGDILKKDRHHSIKYPIYAGVSFSFESAEDMEATFAFKKPAHAYSRISNPTVEAFERKVNLLEGGRGAIALASGMAAISNVFLNLLQQGENIVSASSLFGNTYSLFSNLINKFGIETRFIDIDDLDQVIQAIDDKTRVVFLETISNPKMNVPDISGIVEIAHSRGVVVIVDGTVTTPYLFDAKAFGIDVVVHSSTKLLSGGATSVGGVIIDLGTSTWSGFPSLENHKRKGEWAFLARLRTEVYRDLGACMAPHTAYLQSLGLETLALRVEKVCDNTLKVAKLLKENKKIKTVNYPGLSESPYHALAKKQFKNRFGGVLSFELADKQTCFTFLNKLKIIKRASNLGDNTSLVIHPASTIFREYTPEKKESMGVSEELIRLSVGIENFEDLKKDIQQALE